MAYTEFYCCARRPSAQSDRGTVMGCSRRGTVGPYVGTGPHSTSEPVAATRKRSESSMLPLKIPAMDLMENFSIGSGDFDGAYSAVFNKIHGGDFVLQHCQTCSFPLESGQKSLLANGKKNFNPSAYCIK